MRYQKKLWWGIFVICLTAFTAIAVISDHIFEHVPHSEDEVAYLFQAKLFAQHRLAVPTPPFEDAFWSPFVVDFQGWRFGKYPPGWPLLLSLGVRLNAPWLINALLGTLTLALIAWLGYLFYCDSQEKSACYIPLLTAGLGLLTPGFLFLSSSLLSHAASLFWSTLALLAIGYLFRDRIAYYVVRKNKIRNSQFTIHNSQFTIHNSQFTIHNSQFAIRNSPSLPRHKPTFALLTGFFLGAAFITRPFAGIGIGLAIGIFLLTLTLRGQFQWPVLLWIAAGGFPVAALLPLYWWAIAGDPTFNPYLLVWPYDRIGFGPDIGPMGYTLFDAIFINTRLKLTALATALFGWPGWSNLIFLPIPFIARRANRWDWLLLGTIFSLIFVHIFYWAFGGVDGGFPRYYYDALPGFLLLTARGIQITFNYLRQKKLSVEGKGFQLSWLLVGLLAGFVGHNLIWNLPPLLAAQKGKYGITSKPLQAVDQANLSKPSLILVQSVESWSDFAAPFSANSPTLDGSIVYAIDWGPELTRQLRIHFAERDCWELQEETLKRCPKFEKSY